MQEAGVNPWGCTEYLLPTERRKTGAPLEAVQSFDRQTVDSPTLLPVWMQGGWLRQDVYRPIKASLLRTYAPSVALDRFLGKLLPL